MRLETAIKRIKAEYEKAKRLDWVHDPLAYALYQVWKMADAQIQPKKKDDNDE